jgi:hypothetical protein
MDTRQVFDSFLNDLKQAFPDLQIKDDYSTSKEVKNLETQFYPHLVKVLQKDKSLFDEDHIFCGINISPLWKASESNQEAIWKHLQMCLFASFLHGDIKEKFGTIISTVKSMWNMSGQENDEISKILNDEKAEDRLQELFTYLSETRLAKIFMKMVEEFDISELELNFENPQEIIDMMRNQEHPTMKKIITRVQTMIQDKLQKGAFTQQQLINEVEDIKRKIQGLFGNMFNDMLGGTRSEIPTEYLRGGSPEARRARMLYRMQKQRLEKNSRKK